MASFVIKSDSDSEQRRVQSAGENCTSAENKVSSESGYKSFGAESFVYLKTLEINIQIFIGPL